MAPTIALQFDHIQAPYMETQGEARTLHMPVPTTEEELKRSAELFQAVAVRLHPELSEDAGAAAALIKDVMMAVVDGVPVKEAIAKTCDGKYTVREIATEAGTTEITWRPPEKAQKEKSSTAQSSTQQESTQQAESSSLNSLD